MVTKDSEWSIEAQKRIAEKKSHASFPQLKYPSLRDNGMKDPIQWLQGKVLDDGAEGLWRVHDKLYDFTNFIHKHPGGEEWLELTKGTDITEAFEAHHIYLSAEKLLNKYYIRDANGPRNSPFTFEKDGFYKTLKAEVRKELNAIPKDVSKTADRIVDGILIVLLVTSPCACALNGMAATISYIISSLALCYLTVACHNYIHRRNNWRMYLFNLSMWSYRDFRVSHALSHHLYTNTLMDLEISGLEPILQYQPRKDKPLLVKMGFVTQYMMFPFLFLFSFCRRFILLFRQKNFLNIHYFWHDLFGFLVPVWMCVLTDASFGHVLYTWLWIVCTASLLFFIIGVNAAHHHPDAIKDGDEPASKTPDWGMHQVEALLDRKDINTNTFAVITMFGEHALHHMFPTLDHAVLRYLHPVFLKHCEKYKANYRVSTQFKLVIGQIKECMRTEFRSDSDRRMFK